MAKAKSVQEVAEKKNTPKIRIKLRSYDLKMLETSVAKVLGLLVKSGAKIK